MKLNSQIIMHLRLEHYDWFQYKELEKSLKVKFSFAPSIFRLEF